MKPSFLKVEMVELVEAINGEQTNTYLLEYGSFILASFPNWEKVKRITMYCLLANNNTKTDNYYTMKERNKMLRKYFKTKRSLNV